MITEVPSFLQWLSELSQPLIAGGIIALTGAFFKLASHSSSLVELQNSMEKLHDSVQELSNSFSRYSTLLETTAEQVYQLQSEVERLRDKQNELNTEVMVLKGKLQQ